MTNPRFNIGDPVRKITGSSWYGRIVGTYISTLMPEGYCVESARYPGLIQVYPVGALALWLNADDEVSCD